MFIFNQNENLVPISGTDWIVWIDLNRARISKTVKKENYKGENLSINGTPKNLGGLVYCCSAVTSEPNRRPRSGERGKNPRARSGLALKVQVFPD
jgi:hypothetical protein